MWRIWMAWLYGIVDLQYCWWQLFQWRCSVGFVYRSVLSQPSASKRTLMSRNGTDLYDHLAVNLNEGCIFSYSKNWLRHPSSCGQMVSTLSIYLHQIVGFLAATSDKWVSSVPINWFTYDRAILVRIAVPCNCRWLFSPKTKLFLVRIISVSFIKPFVGGCWTSLVCNAVLQALIPSWWGMLVYGDVHVTSRVAKIVPVGNFWTVFNLV